MKEVKSCCDHCGKELNPMHDYEDEELDLGQYIRFDVCVECYTELAQLVKDFLHKGE